MQSLMEEDGEVSFAKPPSSNKATKGLRGLAANMVSEASQNGGLQYATMLQRKRKRKPGEISFDENAEPESANVAPDNASLASLELSPPPESKRKKGGGHGLARMTSLASVLSTPMAKLARSLSSARLPQPSPNDSVSSNVSVKHHPRTPTKFLVRSASSAVLADVPEAPNCALDSPYGTLKRTGSGRGSTSQLTPYKPPAPTPNKQRPTRYWSEQYAQTAATMARQAVKLQEAIYEVACGEEDLAEDMKLVLTTYAESLRRLQILSSQEADFIFGGLSALLPLHVELAAALRSLRDSRTGLSAGVGQAVLSWASAASQHYVDYCAKLIEVKAFLDTRRESDQQLGDFLRRCLESPFSRKLDLWAYLGNVA